MKRILPLLLLTLLLCQCHNQPKASQNAVEPQCDSVVPKQDVVDSNQDVVDPKQDVVEPNQEVVKLNQELFPEKFTESYIGERVSQMWEKFVEFDMEDGSLKEIFTEPYFKLWEEWSYLPHEYLTELGSAWSWMEAVESLDYPFQILETKVVDDSTAYVILKGNFRNPQMNLAFVGDDWVIDDFDPTSQACLNELIIDQREWMKGLDWDEEMAGMKEVPGLTEEEAVDVVNRFRKNVEAYFAKHPLEQE